MLQTNLSYLADAIQEKARAALEEMNADNELKRLGVSSVIVSETLRHLSTQMAYYARGRMAAADVKMMYKAANLWNISDADAVKQITWTLDSKHLRGLAVDLVPTRHGQTWWMAPEQVWARMGEIGEKHGMSWGGRWPDKKKDSPHFEV
jgi:peptidoglycan L-alanyl-D-glutamate endopeptidase CwlK